MLVENAAGIKYVFREAAAGCVAHAGIGNSNQKHDVYGHDWSQQRALGLMFRQYATPAYPITSYYNSGMAVMGYKTTATWNQDDNFANSAASNPLFTPGLSYDTPADMPSAYQGYGQNPPIYDNTFHSFYVPPNAYFSRFFLDIQILSDSLIGIVNKALRFRWTRGKFASGSGYFQPSLRVDSSIGVQRGTKTFTNSGSTGLVDEYWDITPVSPTTSIQLALHAWPSDTIFGPFFGTYWQVERPDVLSGIRYSTAIFQGGQTSRNAALRLQGLSDATIDEWIRQQVFTRPDPTMMVWINHFQNELGDSNNSVGPNPAPTNTVAGYVDNIIAIRSRWTDRWLAGGYDPDRLAFIVNTEHPQDRDVVVNGVTKAFSLWQQEFEDGAAGIGGNVGLVRGSAVTTTAYLTANNMYYTPDGTQAHMSQSGYEYVDGLHVQNIANATMPLPPKSSRLLSYSGNNAIIQVYS